jgi:hypothetical protein
MRVQEKRVLRGISGYERDEKRGTSKNYIVTLRSKSRCALRLRYGTGSGLYRRWWTSLPTSFISAQRLSESRSAESVCE